MRLETPLDLMSQSVQALYNAESQLILALPRVAARVRFEPLRRALEQHLSQTRTHAARLEQIASMLSVPCGGRRCLAMEGLLREGDENMGFGGDPALVDAAIIASCQGVEHYEISQYRALKDLAFESPDIVQLLDATLEEEEQASNTLAQFSQHGRAAGAPQ